MGLHFRAPDLAGLEWSPSRCIFKEPHSDSGVPEPDSALGVSWGAGTVRRLNPMEALEWIWRTLHSCGDQMIMSLVLESFPGFIISRFWSKSLPWVSIWCDCLPWSPDSSSVFLFLDAFFFSLLWYNGVGPFRGNGYFQDEWPVLVYLRVHFSLMEFITLNC